ncbi:CDP-glycerol glycerophosphotransferase family protein [Cytobacillus horneckiae]|uniref:CDP-glycerol glycerophosphotransferase family protein n=1 Tax=Cytobacillus horneckiae TaxID=549687 RepID=UPI0019D13DC9|nr:CDP-glycerol glycerophosphotransferase family protein [Cytobacillus horneckiae]MBN6885253.1 CDP-glycerol glycerophosphotransferase family protein [Cytobacillus horneckiae]
MIPTLIVKYLIRLAFLFSCVFFSVKDEKVTFASYRSTKLEGNLYYIYNEFGRMPQEFKYRFLFKKLDSSFKGKIVYFIHMLKASYHLATSRYFIIDDYYFPVYVISKPRAGTDIVQLWHAAGAFKKFGYSLLNKEYGPSEEYIKSIKVHGNYTKVYVSTNNVVPHYAEAFQMSQEKIFPLGLPRTDFFFEHKNSEKLRDRLNQRYPHVKNKKLMLYAPTFRGSGHYQDRFQGYINVPYLNEKIGVEYSLLIHLHPYMKSGMEITQENQEFACHVDGEFTIEELLVLSDVLITDYSSVIFDYSLLEKPMVFFAPDLEEYTKERDFYYNYKSMIPGPLFSKTEELVEWLLNGDWDAKRVKDFKAYFFDYHDGKASERILKHLLDEHVYKE